MMPNLENNQEFPIANSSAVFRILTRLNNKKVSISSYWVEVPIAKSKIAIFDEQGNNLPFIQRLSINEKKIFNAWRTFLIKKAKTNYLDEVLKASLILHKKLPYIDKVAWDWIKSKNKTYLLEGNSSYGLLIPQSFYFLNKKNKHK